MRAPRGLQSAKLAQMRRRDPFSKPLHSMPLRCNLLQVDDDGLFKVKMQEGGSFLATGSVDGSVYMLELCEGLACMQQNEKQSVSQMLERESKREKNLEARAKELRQKEKRASEMTGGGEDSEKTATPWDDQVKDIEAEFWKLVQKDEEAAPEGDK